VTPGKLIRAVRRRNGLTQQELARRAGTTQPVVSAYEHGRRDPSLGTLRRLIEAAGEQVVLDARPLGVDVAPARDDQERSRRLLDVLSLVDAIGPKPRSRSLRAPRMVSS
jgi:hypothetical protein